ncbi:TPA: YcjX family protein, partial [Mannheimia haemolytica]|nr:YcjX family protein [Mannheimia haemolytica]
MFSKIHHKLNNFVQRGLDNHLRLAVTGLSRSGKTAFITSLVDQLLHINKGGNSHLNLFAPARHGQILSVKRVEQGDLTIPRFEYDKNRQSLENQPPQWPESTTGISEIRLAIRYQRQ